MSRQPSNVTSTTTQSLPEWMRPYQEQLFQQGQQAINGMNPQDMESPYGDVSPWNQAQQTASNMIIGRALQGSPIQDAAQGYMFDALSGGHMSPYAGMENEFSGYSPQFNQMLQSSNDAISDSYAKGVGASNNIRFNKAGTLGGSAWQETTADNEARLASSLADNTRNMMDGQWQRSAGLEESRLGRQEGAFQSMMGRNAGMLGLAPQFQQMDYYDMNQMLGAGDRQYQYQQSVLDAMNNNYFNNINFPMSQLDRGLGLLRGISGNSGVSTMTQPRQGGGTNWGGAAGGLLMGLMGG
jgi:hypothetical protein